MAVNAVGQATNADGIIVFHDNQIKLLYALNRAAEDQNPYKFSLVRFYSDNNFTCRSGRGREVNTTARMQSTYRRLFV